MTDINMFPKQRLSYAEKSKNNYQWAKDVVDYLLLNYAATNNSANGIDDYERMLSNYQLYNNILNQKDFERECNPFGIEIGQFKDYIQPYNKTPNKIQVLLGEEVKRPFTYKTVLVNDDGIRAKQEYKNQMLRQFLMNEIQTVVASLTGDQASQEEVQQMMGQIIPPENLDEYMSKSYLDGREHLANQILTYLFKKLRTVERKNDGFKHGLISGIEAIWVGAENGEPVCTPLNSLGLIYHKSPEVKYIEDGLFAGYRTFMTIGDILDKFGDYLEEKDLKRLEGTMRGVQGIRDDIISKRMTYQTDDVYDYYLRNYLNSSTEEGSYGKASGIDWIVSHVEWKSQKRVGFINYVNEFGDEQEDIVSEEFTIPPYAEKTTVDGDYGRKRTVYQFDGNSLEWGWIPEVWQGVRIGDDMYCMLGPKEYQYRSLDNPKNVKLGYHGVVYNNMNADSVSLMDRMKPFQYLYFIIVHKLKKLIARDRGRLFHFDVSMVPEELGIEKTLYYLEEMDIDFYNPLQNTEQAGINQRSKITTATDRSNMQHILNYVSLMAAIDEQMGDVAGVTRQREGQTLANEAVTNSQQNIIQSSTITEAVYFMPHEKLWENVLNSMVQCAQAIWKNKSMIKQYVLDDLSVQTLKLTPESLQNSDFSVFVSNSSKDNEVFNTLKQLAQPLLQNDKAKMSDIIRMIKAESANELESSIIASEDKMQKQMLEQIQAQQEAQRAQQETMMQLEAQKMQHEKELQAQKDNAALQREIIKLQASSGEANVDPIAAAKLALEAKKLETSTDLKEKELDMKSDEAEKDRENALKIAKMRKSQSSQTKKSS